MAQPVCRLGDTSDHGGHIVQCVTSKTFNGKLVATIGALHSCPIHGVTQIVSTPQSKDYAEGQLIATIGAKAGCGATMNTGSPNVYAR
jgi:uncharacterized Zn-binding protein involved in type VI secretion